MPSRAPALPPELDVLRSFGIADAPLHAAAKAARREGVCPAHWLIANGHATARTYYEALARHAGLAFVAGWPRIAPETDPVAACRVGLVRLDGEHRRWLLAPEGRHLRAFLEARLDPALVAITTPAHLAALVHRGAGAAVERIASDALPDAAPHLSAWGAVTARLRVIGIVVALLALAASYFVPRIVGDAFGVAFFAGICFRLWLAAESFGDEAVAPPRLSDAALPTYSVLVPLRQEAPLVPELLAALEVLDYPRAKLEVLVLVEPEDLATRRALAGAPLPPWLRVVVGPVGGRLRTKPRALNIGLAMARGTLVTVYDAEDRPEPDQLRRAAAAFAVTPERLACLQARLAIDPRTKWLTRAIMEQRPEAA